MCLLELREVRVRDLVRVGVNFGDERLKVCRKRDITGGRFAQRRIAFTGTVEHLVEYGVTKGSVRIAHAMGRQGIVMAGERAGGSMPLGGARRKGAGLRDPGCATHHASPATLYPAPSTTLPSTMPILDPQNAAAVVTGHSRGLGEAIAAHLLARGARVLGVSRGENPALAARFPGTLVQAQLDVADAAALTRFLETDRMSRFLEGRTPLLVNNAGVLQPIGPLPSQDPQLIVRAVSVNVAAVMAFSAAFIQATSDTRERRILHVSSGAGRKPYAGWSIYCATKAAIDQHARCVELDRTPHLAISSVAPGVVDTEMQAEIRASSDDRFPDRPRFVALHRDKSLPSPEHTGGRVVDYLLSDVFGREAVFDLRDFSENG